MNPNAQEWNPDSFNPQSSTSSRPQTTSTNAQTFYPQQPNTQYGQQYYQQQQQQQQQQQYYQEQVAQREYYMELQRRQLEQRRLQQQQQQQQQQPQQSQQRSYYNYGNAPQDTYDVVSSQPQPQPQPQPQSRQQTNRNNLNDRNNNNYSGRVDRQDAVEFSSAQRQTQPTNYSTTANFQTPSNYSTTKNDNFDRTIPRKQEKENTTQAKVDETLTKKAQAFDDESEEGQEPGASEAAVISKTKKRRKNKKKARANANTTADEPSNETTKASQDNTSGKAEQKPEQKNTTKPVQAQPQKEKGTKTKEAQQPVTVNAKNETEKAQATSNEENKKKQPQPQTQAKPQQTQVIATGATKNKDDQTMNKEGAVGKDTKLKHTPAQTQTKSSEGDTTVDDEKIGSDETAKKKGDKKKTEKKLELETANQDLKEHITLVLIGHVDAGKSTTAGQILLLSGQIDQRTVEKQQREAKERGREGWWLAYATDQDDEEKSRGKTIDCARVEFETQKKRFTLVDAPGHNNYVPNMISGAALADVAILIISARSGEYEAGFRRGGQTREHALLAFTLGVSRVVVVVNKMDNCDWKQERFDVIKKEVSAFLKEIGFKEKSIDFLPASSISGLNFKDPLPPSVCPWYKGDSFLTLLDGMEKIKRMTDKPLAITVLQRYKGDFGLTAIGKVEAGFVSVGDNVLVLPCNQTAVVTHLFIDEKEVKQVTAGENILICFDARAKVTAENLIDGSVVCDPDDPCLTARKFRAEVYLSELPNESILTAGYCAMLHLHNIAVECEVIAIPHKIHPKTRKRSREPHKFLRTKDSAIIDIEVKSDPIPIMAFKDLPKLGRFALRDQGITTVIGRVLEILQ